MIVHPQQHSSRLLPWCLALAGLAVFSASAPGSAESIWLASHTFGSPTTAGNGGAFASALSADGRYLAFQSDATDLISGGTDKNGQTDAFFWDRETGEVRLISHVAGSATTSANGVSFLAGTMSADGRWVIFQSEATDLIAGISDSNNATDTFLWDRDSGLVTLVSHIPGSPATTGNGPSSPQMISSNGRYVCIVSSATNLIAGGVDTNAVEDAFLWDRETGSITLISHVPASPATAGNSSSFPVVISDDGRYTVFISLASDLVAGGSDTNLQFDVFQWDRDTGAVTLLSHAPGSATTTAEGASIARGVSADGRFVAFESTATNLIAGATDANDGSDVFLWDRDAGSSTLVSHVPASPTTTGNGSCSAKWISADGQYVTFTSLATNLIAGGVDSNIANDVFLWTRDTGAVTLISHAASSATTAGNAVSEQNPLGITPDGRFVVYYSAATNLIAGSSDANGTWDVFLWNRETGVTILISHAAVSPTTAGNGESVARRISADGRFVAFYSTATTLMPGTFGAFSQAFLANPFWLFGDDFESGDTASWDLDVP